MGKYSDPLKLYDAQRARFIRNRMTMEQAHKDLAELGLKDMEELTDGNLTPKQTRGAFARGASPSESTQDGERRMLTKRQIANRGLGPVPRKKGAAGTSSPGRKPRARKKGRGPKRGGPKHVVPLLPINKQSSALHEAMKLEDVSIGSRQSFDVGPEGVDYAQFVLAVGGTSKMVARGFFAEVRKRWKARNKAFFDQYIRKARRP